MDIAGIISHLVADIGLSRNSITRDFERDGGILTEQDINAVYVDWKANNPKGRKDDFFMVLSSSKIPLTNPIKDFIETIEYDGQDHIKALAECVDTELGFGEKQFDPFMFEKFLRKWLVALVASIEPQHYNILMLILIGEPHTGKTEFFRRLLPNELKKYFAQSKLDKTNDAAELMGKKLLVLCDELDGFTKAEGRSFRWFISSDSYTLRLPYGKTNITIPRLASIAGTSNDENVIDDSNNNRRIIPVKISKIHFKKYNAVDKCQLLAQAYKLAKSDFDFELSTEERQFLKLMSADFEVSTREIDMIMKLFRRPEADEVFEFRTATDIANTIQSHCALRISEIYTGRALKQLGYEQTRQTIEGKQQRVYKVIEKKLSTANGNGFW